MLRVLLVHANLDVGGTERHLLNLLRAAEAGDVRFEIAWTARWPGRWHQQFVDLGVTLHKITDSKYLVGFGGKLRRLIVRRGYDAVCGFCPQNIGRVVRAAKAAGVRSRLACYRSANPHCDGLSPRSIYLRIDRRLAHRYATRLVGNSRAVLDAYFPSRDMQSDRYRVWPNGLDLDRFGTVADRQAIRHSLGIAPDDVVVGHVGRFMDAKNHAVVIEVAQRLRRRYPTLRLLLVGDGPLRGDIETRLAAAGLTDAAILPGFREDIPQMLACMDLFVFPSTYEGSPNALLEAMAAGVPFVAGDIAPNRDAAGDAGTAWLADPHDVDALTRLAEELLESSARRDAQTAAAQRRVREHFSAGASLRWLLRTIHDDLDNGRQVGRVPA